MSIDEKTVEKVAKLARIEIDASKKQAMTIELSNIFKWVEQLSEVNTDDIEPMTSVVENQAFKFREDRIVQMNSKEDVLKNASHSMQDFYTVPKVVE